MAAVASAVLPDPVGPMRATEPRLPWRRAARPRSGWRTRSSVARSWRWPAIRPSSIRPVGGTTWSTASGSDVGGGGLAGLGVLPEAAAPAVAVEAPPHHDEPRERGRDDQRDDGGARPVEPRGRQPAGVGGPRLGGWLASGEAGGGAEPDVDPAVDAAAGERDGEPRSGPRREAGGEHQTAGGDQGGLEAGAWLAGPGSARPMTGHCRIDTSTATAEAARRYGANGADFARAARASRWTRRGRRAPRRRPRSVMLAVP